MIKKRAFLLLLGFISIIIINNVLWMNAFEKREAKWKQDEFIRCLDVLDMESYLNMEIALKEFKHITSWHLYHPELDSYSTNFVVENAHLYPNELLERIDHNPYLEELSKKNRTLISYAKSQGYPWKEEVANWTKEEWAEAIRNAPLGGLNVRHTASWFYWVGQYTKLSGIKPISTPVSPSKYKDLAKPILDEIMLLPEPQN